MADERTSEEKLLIALSGLGAILGFVLPLVAYVLKKDSFSEYTKKYLTDVLNFEIIILIISIILAFIPILGWIASLGLCLFNLIVVLRAFIAAQEGKEYDFVIKYQIIK